MCVLTVFSNLPDSDSQFDFSVVLAPVPAVTQDRLPRWIADALVEEFAPELVVQAAMMKRMVATTRAVQVVRMKAIKRAHLARPAFLLL